jgi:hypothetical protein
MESWGAELLEEGRQGAGEEDNRSVTEHPILGAGHPRQRPTGHTCLRRGCVCVLRLVIRHSSCPEIGSSYPLHPYIFIKKDRMAANTRCT